MHRVLKRFFALFLCITFLIISVISIPVNALTYENKDSFKDIRFVPGGSSVTAYPDKFYNYDYWIITVRPYSYDRQTEFYAYLYLIADNSYENFGSVEGTLKFDIGQYPSNNKLYAVSTSPTLDYKQSVYCKTTMTFNDPNCTWNIFGDSVPFPAENPITGFVFDNYQSDMFPVYHGSSSNFTSQMIIASNVDIYSYNGDLLQYGNYYTLIQYLGDHIDKSRIKDYSGHETAPGVVVEPSTGSSSGGTSSGDNQTSKDQLETSKGIWGTVKDVLKNIISLPVEIATAVGQVLADALKLLVDDILDGLKFLFIPENNPFQGLIDSLHGKFGIIFQIFDLVNLAFDNDLFVDAPPDLSFDFSGYKGNSRFIRYLDGFKFELIDWSVIEPYRKFIKDLIAGITWFFFIRRIKNQGQRILHGDSPEE